MLEEAKLEEEQLQESQLKARWAFLVKSLVYMGGHRDVKAVLKQRAESVIAEAKREGEEAVKQAKAFSSFRPRLPYLLLPTSLHPFSPSPLFSSPPPPLPLQPPPSAPPLTSSRQLLARDLELQARREAKAMRLQARSQLGNVKLKHSSETEKIKKIIQE
eukprot:752254-Hanusia_phi.AAC.1